MKKFVCLLVAALLLLSISFAETLDARKMMNPEEYTLIKVIDTWVEDDSDEYIVQGSFGEYIWELEEMEGFHAEDAYPLILARDAVIELPDANGRNVPATIDDLDAFVSAIRETNEDISFYCDFEMNEDGVLTMLSYCIPGEGEYEDTAPTREFYNPNNYPLLKVEDAFQCEDGDYVVCGTFGECDYTDEAYPIFYGFEEPGMLIVLAEDAVIEMSSNLDDESNVPMSIAEFVDLVAQKLDSCDGEYSFCCRFEMNDNGVLTQLVYSYLPY